MLCSGEPRFPETPPVAFGRVCLLWGYESALVEASRRADYFGEVEECVRMCYSSNFRTALKFGGRDINGVSRVGIEDRQSRAG